ncbi:AraC family transcriptional regulator [Acinetobacter sp. ANC 4558]|uniref:helix-turn-helix domain-containing protein n=1 Tax=Acinetobacter sp. ANC 4558 TaxID=1977876 RepID=UPI000A359E4F|nr:AraC family transcriptional regulator [Acinetobacter sp. ANC 4558]OTG86130.1 AraC family transcriptional regulator [Acinetobacter sp. ANC 4558]
MSNWVNVEQDKKTGIELIHAHFKGHAYDPHFHSSYLMGVTESGIQQFHCRKKLIQSHQGQVFMLEPGEVHDGYAPEPFGFTYKMLHIDPQWIKHRYDGLFEKKSKTYELSIESTLKSDHQIANLVLTTFHAIQHKEPQLLIDTKLDFLLEKLVDTQSIKFRENAIQSLPDIALEIRDILHENIFKEISLDELAQMVGIDRFYINRVFKQSFNSAPHQYLIRLRLDKAKELIKQGFSLATIATNLCFSDQSHLGRWFRRCYGMTLYQYQKSCTNILYLD